jgi:hypothetical protein
MNAIRPAAGNIADGALPKAAIPVKKKQQTVNRRYEELFHDEIKLKHSLMIN